MKQGKLVSEYAVEAAAAIITACPERFRESVEARVTGGEDWKAAAVTEFMSLVTLLKVERASTPLGRSLLSERPTK
jgi:hypothetical protein